MADWKSVGKVTVGMDVRLGRGRHWHGRRASPAAAQERLLDQPVGRRRHDDRERSSNRDAERPMVTEFQRYHA